MGRNERATHLFVERKGSRRRTLQSPLALVLAAASLCACATTEDESSNKPDSFEAPAAAVEVPQGVAPADVDELRGADVPSVDAESGATYPATARIGTGRGDRAVEVVFVNRSAQRLTFRSGSASAGIWATTVPSYINAGTYGRWETESNGFMTGTAAWIRYDVPGAGTAFLQWDNPFTGSNAYSATAPAGYVIDRVGGEQNKATVFFILRPATTSYTSCAWPSAVWILDNMLKNDEIGDGINWFDQGIAFVTTHLFKENDIEGWGSTGCRTNDGSGVVLRDGQYSSDGYWTIDIRLTHIWGSDYLPPQTTAKYVRLEVKPGTAARAYLDWRGYPVAGQRIWFSGTVLIDHGQFIEVHPDNVLSY